MMMMERVIFVLLVVNKIFCQLEGHMKPLGQQRKSEGHIEILDKVPDPITFHKDFIVGSKPVVFRGAAKNIPAFELWTDDYMKEHFGDLTCDVEEGKKENRSLGMWKWNYAKFLDRYQSEDVYMVNSLRGKLLEDLRLLPSLVCGGFTKMITDVIMWFSSGGTKSVLHNDRIDNINCLFSGIKELYMVDKKYSEFVVFDAEEGAFSKVDVDAVNLEKYPGLAKAPWWQAKMQAGDCLFIPEGWFHQVRSHTDNKRNMAVNVWFHHLPLINETECENHPELGRFMEFTEEIKVGVSQEMSRFALQLQAKDGPVSYKDFIKSVLKFSQDMTSKNVLREVISMLDKNKDKHISLEEINALTDGEMEFAAKLFPLFMSEEDAEESESESENSNEDLIKKKKTEL